VRAELAPLTADEHESFERALELEDERLAGETDRMREGQPDVLTWVPGGARMIHVIPGWNAIGDPLVSR
jgi:hypothetical protein